MVIFKVRLENNLMALFFMKRQHFLRQCRGGAKISGGTKVLIQVGLAAGLRENQFFIFLSFSKKDIRGKSVS